MTNEEAKEEMMLEKTAPGAMALNGAPDVEKGAKKPPPQQTKQPPPPSGSSKNSKKKCEKNPDFKDVENTGRWGSISKKEMIIVGIVFLAVIGGVVAAVVVLTGNGNNAPNPTLPPRTPVPTPAPTFPPEVDPNLQLPVILEAVETNAFINASLALLPSDAAFYKGKAADASLPPLVRAISWSLYEDKREPLPNDPFLVPRFALASIYYAFSGEQWTRQGDWLTYAPVCDWDGIYCDRFNAHVNEVSLPDNNLVGKVPAEFSMLSELISVGLHANKLTGTVPWEALGSLPTLSFLFLNANKLSGTIDGSVRNNGVLSTLMVQLNDFTGQWPRNAFCDPVDRKLPLLENYGLDCDELDFRCLCGCTDPDTQREVCF